MTENVDSLVLDLLEWIGPDARPYGEVMDAWKTSCPRLPVWEEANDRGYIVRHGEVVRLSPAGTQYLKRCRADSAR
jgi:D-3-phosphoglycerate dehydrogenase